MNAKLPKDIRSNFARSSLLRLVTFELWPMTLTLYVVALTCAQSVFLTASSNQMWCFKGPTTHYTSQFSQSFYFGLVKLKELKELT